MRAALALALALALVAVAAPARAGTPLALAERQVVTLEFDRVVARLAVTDPDVVALAATGARVRVTALRGGRTGLELTFEDGATVAYDLVVAGATRPAARAEAPGEVSVSVGEERRLPFPRLARVLLEETGVAKVRAEANAVVVLGLSTGAASLVLVDETGGRATYALRVR
jgi:hypothetical protein